MNSAIFECEIITPMFLSGADGKTPELRAPSIKGMMRYWWRAIQAESNIEDLRTEEARMFGSSDENIGRSKFSIRITSSVIKEGDITNQKPLPHHTGDNNCPFLPSCKGRNSERCSKGFTIPAIKPKYDFKIKLCAADKNMLNPFANILEATLCLGGIGKRSRRGFGSIYCKKWNFKDPNILLDFILKKLNAVKSDFEIKTGKKILRKTKCTANYPYIKEISAGNEEKDINTLLKKIGQATHDYKNSSLGYTGKYNNDTIRMASPIYVSIAKVDNGFVPVITTLNFVSPNPYPNCDISKQNNFKDSL